GGGGTPSDIGDNSADVVVAIGDSITEGRAVPAGAPYPDRLAAMTGKQVVNAGVSGDLSSGGASRIGGRLSRHKPAFVCIQFGANDLIKDRSDEEVIANINSMIAQAKANKTVPIVGNLLPMYDSHEVWNARVNNINPKIANAAKAGGARFVNLNKEFSGKRDLIQADGLHPSDRGNTVIAAAFSDKI
ncbi:MAG: GDSL-type esterase/lipase family protein, partial [Verrucomicrobiota bacterium]